MPLLRLLLESPWANNLTFGLSQKQTLMSTNISLFAQVVRLLPGPLIKNLSAEFQVDKHSKPLTGWQHPVSMISANSQTVFACERSAMASGHRQSPSVDSSLQACNGNLTQEVP